MKKNRYLHQIVAGICLAVAIVFLTAGRVQAKTYTEESNFGHNTIEKAMTFAFGEQRAEITIQGQVGKTVNNGPDEAADDFYRFEFPADGLLAVKLDSSRYDQPLKVDFLDAKGTSLLDYEKPGAIVTIMESVEKGERYYLRLIAQDYHNAESYNILVTYHPDKTTHSGDCSSKETAAIYKLGTWEVYSNPMRDREAVRDYSSKRWYRFEIPQAGEYLLDTACFPGWADQKRFVTMRIEGENNSLVGDVYDVNHEPVIVDTPKSGYLYESFFDVFAGNVRKTDSFSEEDLKRILKFPKAGTYYLIADGIFTNSEYQFRITRLSGDTEPETTKAEETAKAPETTEAPETTKTPETTKAQGSSGTSGKTVVAKGKTFKVSGVTYKVTKEKKTVTYRKAKTDATSVKVPDTIQYKGYTYQVTSIHKSAFPKKTLKKLTVGKYVQEIPAGTFEDFAKLTEVTFAKNCVLKKIGADAFRASGLKKITIPASVTSIGDTAFMICNNLQSVVIGNKVTTIGLYAFAGCGKLTTVTIGSKVKTIGEGCFADDTALKTITIRSTVLKTVKEDAFARTRKYASVTVPAGKVSAYKKLLRKAGLATTAKVTVKK